MRETFHIISDGSCDLPSELVQEKNITVVPFYVSFDDEHYFKENVEIGIRDFYQQMIDKKGVYPKSSMPSIQDYEEVFLPFARDNMPVICICITTKFSGSMQSALNARSLVLEKYPQAQITVIDATINTVLQGQYVLEAAELRDHGFSYSDAAARLEEIKHRKNLFHSGKHGIFKTRRKNRQSSCPCRRRTGYPPRYHVKERRDLPLRYRQGTEAHTQESYESPFGISAGKQSFM